MELDKLNIVNLIALVRTYTKDVSLSEDSFEQLCSCVLSDLVDDKEDAFIY